MAQKYTDIIDTKNEEKITEILNELPDYCKLYFRYLKTKNRASRTRVQYALDMKRFFLYLQEQAGFKNINISKTSIKELDNLSREDFLDYFDSLTLYKQKDAKGNEISVKASPESLARKMSSLRSFFAFYHKEGMIEHDFSKVIDVPSVPKHEIITLEQHEIDRLLNTINDIEGMDANELAKHKKTAFRDEVIVRLLLGTGIRVSELVGLNLKDYDEYNAKLLVRRKGGDFDEVYLGESVENKLKEYIENSREILLGDNEDEEAMFVSMHHKRMTDRSIQKMIKKYGDKAGIPPEKCLSPHKFRKTFGTNLYLMSNDIELVASSLNHKSIATTKAHYAKANEEHKRKAAEISETMFKE